MRITEEQLNRIFPNSTERDRLLFADNFDKVCHRFGLATTLRSLCAFVAQVGHESAELKIKSENLNYSTDILVRLFGKYFKSYEEAKCYARHPEAIANRIYANRMGNGNEQSGDGWKYRGRGLIQLTGRDNYRRFSMVMDEDYLREPAELTFYPAALSSAGWFWSIRGLEDTALLLDDCTQEIPIFKKITRKINGGLIGLEHRLELYERAKKVMTSFR